MRRLAVIGALVALSGFVVAGALADGARTYRVELDNAFGLVEGSDLKIAGVRAGSLTDIDINQRKKAVATVELRSGFTRLRKSATCVSRPQSLIAEFFLDCDPGEGAELEENGLVPVERTNITVQPDLVNNILREPFKRRLQLIINEFGTGLAGRPKDLNSAVRRGAPALRETEKVLRVLASQNRIIRDLNADSDEIFKELADNRKNVSRFITEARETAQASAERRQDISASFNKLPTFLAELRPTMTRLGELADEQSPVLDDLRASASELKRFTDEIQPFSDASLPSFETLGEAAKVGDRALSKGKEEVSELKRFSDNVKPVSRQLHLMLRDLDDRDKAVEADPRSPGGKGYTGFEGLLNFGYIQAGSLNTFDEIGHTLRIVLIESNLNPCGSYTTEISKKADGSFEECVNLIGPNQPQAPHQSGLTETVDVPPYDPSICPKGSANHEICNPGGQSTSGATGKRGSGRKAPQEGPAEAPQPQAPQGGGGGETPQKVVPDLPKPLRDILDLPKRIDPEKLPDVPGTEGLKKDLKQGLRGGGLRSRSRHRATTNDLLEFLFSN